MVPNIEQIYEVQALMFFGFISTLLLNKHISFDTPL